MLPFESMPELSIEPGLLPDTARASVERPAPADVPAKASKFEVREQGSHASLSEPIFFTSTDTQD